MCIDEHYDETLDIIHKTFRHIFEGLENRFGDLLSAVREQYPSEAVTFTDGPCVVHWEEGMRVLTEGGFDVGDGMGDLTGAMVSYSLGSVCACLCVCVCVG